jgi:hypothetical protein
MNFLFIDIEQLLVVFLQNKKLRLLSSRLDIRDIHKK